jgi:hypothetical protein
MPRALTKAHPDEVQDMLVCCSDAQIFANSQKLLAPDLNYFSINLLQPRMGCGQHMPFENGMLTIHSKTLPVVVNITTSTTFSVYTLWETMQNPFLLSKKQQSFVQRYDLADLLLVQFFHQARFSKSGRP